MGISPRGSSGADQGTASTGGRLEHLPVALFSAVMGLGGVSLAWRRAALVWGVPEWPHLVFLTAAVLAARPYQGGPPQPPLRAPFSQLGASAGWRLAAAC